MHPVGQACQHPDRSGPPATPPPPQEIGPRFTLKLQSLQKGTFDSKGGEFEWVHKPETETTRKKMQL